MIGNMHNLILQVFMYIIVLTGQSNMDRSAEYITALLPGYEVVNCARGGTSVTQWQRGQKWYELCVDRVLELKNEGYTVSAIFHMQGERDSYDPIVAPQWRAFTYQFFSHFRQDTNSIGVPVVTAQIGTLPTDKPRPYWGLIQEQQEDIPLNHPTLYLIHTSDIVPYCPVQGPHWCPEGYAEIAARFVGEFWQVIE